MRYFLIYLFLEIFVSVNISSQIGALATFLEVVFSAIVGFILIANFRITFFESIMALQQRTISLEEFQKLNAFTLLGAILLIIPGFLSDIIGIFLQFGFFATLFAKKILHVKEPDTHEYYHTKREDDDEIIDVEVIDEHSRIKH